MALIGRSMFDLADMYNQLAPQNKYTPVLEMLSEMPPILDDAIAQECNNGTTHKHTIRTGLPTSTWGMLYMGVQDSMSKTMQVTDTTGYIKAKSIIDADLLELAGDNANAMRLGEAQSHLESMAQTMGSTIFYGNSNTDPEQFMGFAPRFNLLSAPNGNQIVDAGGTGADNTSLWIITWGDSQCHLLYPKNTQAGVKREDMGKQKQIDADGGSYYAMEEVFTWHMGLAVKDWRYVVRIANIDMSNLRAGTVAIYDFLRTAYYKLQSTRVAGGKQAIYCNRDVLEALDRIATNAGATDNFIRLKTTEVEGREVNTYRGIPIRDTDALLNTEARVV